MGLTYETSQGMIQPYLTSLFSLRFWLLTLLLVGAGDLWSQACIDTFPYVADFETTNGGWSGIDIAPGNPPSSWVWTTNIANPIISNAASGTGCWVTGNNPTLAPPNEPYSYFAGEQSAAVSPCFDFSNLQNPGIQFNIWWESEAGEDGTIFQYSTNGGVTWITLGNYLDPFNWYQDSSISSLGFAPGWSGDTLQGNTGSNGWVSAQRQLAFLAGQPNVRFRFLFASNLDPALASIMDGFAFDDVVVADHPVVDLGPDTTLCFTQAITLDICHPEGVSYAWNTNPSDTSCTLTVGQGLSYIGFLTDSTGFVVTDTITLTLSPTFVNLGPNQTICPGDTLTLDASSAAASYAWTPGGQTTPTIQAFETGEYSVTVSDTFGCVTQDSVNILVDPVPPVDLGEDTAICAGSTIALNAGEGPPGTTYTWSPISASTQTVLVASPGEYSVSVNTPAGCSATDTVNISVSLFPVVNLGPDRAVCDSVVLNAGNPGASYQWSTGAADTNQTYTVATPGTIWVDVVNQAGCATSDTVAITISTAPTVALGPDTFICNNQPIDLDAGLPGQSYFWSNGDTTQVTTVSLPGNYIANVTNAAGCTGRDTIGVIRSTLAVNLGADRVICDGDTTTLDAGPVGEVYQWSTGASTRRVEVSQAGTYSVSVTDTLGCTVNDEVMVSLQAAPQPSIAISGDTVLFGTVNFAGQSMGNPLSWTWSFGDGNQASGQNVSHTYVSQGTFEVCLTVEEGVCIRSVCDLVSIVVVGLEDHPGVDFALYPNPTHDWLNLALTLPRRVAVQARLRDLAGRELWQQGFGVEQQVSERIDLRAFSPGWYLLELRVGAERFFYKVRRQ